MTRFQKVIRAIAAAVTLLIAAALGVLTKPMYPIKEGTSNEFWSSAIGVNLRGASQIPGAACFDGDYAYYMPVTMDASWTLRVPKSEVMRDYPALLTACKLRGDPKDVGSLGYARWKQLSESEQTPENLIACVDDAWIGRILAIPGTAPGANLLPVEMRDLMHQHIGKSKHYWANFVFELLYLGGLTWFIAWPFIRGRALLQRLAHLFVAPSLFLLPAWLGYCFVIATGAGPAGGILYPWLLTFLHAIGPAGYVGWEFVFFRAMPKVLDAINQCPAFAFDEVLLVDFFVDTYASGPLWAVGAGAILCMLLLLFRLCRWGMRRWDAREKRPKSFGFEVLPTKDSQK